APDQVLADLPEVGALWVVLLDAFPERRPVRRLVLEVAVVEHLVGVLARGGGKRGVELERAEAVSEADGVHIAEGAALERGRGRARTGGRLGGPDRHRSHEQSSAPCGQSCTTSHMRVVGHNAMSRANRKGDFRRAAGRAEGWRRSSPSWGAFLTAARP